MAHTAELRMGDTYAAAEDSPGRAVALGCSRTWYVFCDAQLKDDATVCSARDAVPNEMVRKVSKKATEENKKPQAVLREVGVVAVSSEYRRRTGRSVICASCPLLTTAGEGRDVGQCLLWCAAAVLAVLAPKSCADLAGGLD